MELGVIPTIKLALNDISEEEKDKILEEHFREHEERLRMHWAAHLLEKKKADPRYQFIDYGYRCRYFKDSKDESITKKGMVFVNRFDDFFRPQHKGIYISGSVGTGKSYLASMIANEMADKGYSIYMARINDAIDAFNDLNNKDLANRIKARYFSLIILDDLGSSRTTDYQVERLYNLIDTIYNSEIPLIVTTNIPIGVLAKEQNLGLKRVYDRIIEMCGYFPPMTGDSKRIEEARRLMGVTKSLFDDI